MTDEHELSRGKKIAFSLVAIALFGALLAGAGEMILRWIAPTSDPVKLGTQLEGSARLYGLKPNVLSRKTGVMVQTNRLGFREKDYPVQRHAGLGRIVVLGDSYTFGTGVEFEQTYAKRLEAALARAGRPHEVINFGVPGYNTTVELATWREVAARYQPDLVIVGYVLNDAEQLGAGGRTSGGDEGKRSLLNATHQALKDWSMLYRFAAPSLGAVASLFGARYSIGKTNDIIRSYDEDAPGWVESREALLKIAQEVRAAGAQTLVVIFPMMVDFSSYPLEAAHARVAQFCRRHGIDALDLLPSLRNEKASGLIVLLDGHPNGRAHRIFADAIHAHLESHYFGNDVQAAAHRPSERK